MADCLLDRVKREHSPLIDQNQVTFVWAGEGEPPHILGDFNGWGNTGGTTLEPAGNNTWALTVELPDDAYIEYAFMMGERPALDPFNPRHITNGMGSENNYFAMPACPPNRYKRRDKAAARGRVFSEVIQAGQLVVGERRRVHFYQPPVDEPCPLLVVYDGQDYLRRAYITQTIDNLIHTGCICPVALAMPEHGRKARLIEYGCSDITLGFIDSCVIPAARRQLNLLDPVANPGSYGVLGASLGGLMALYTGLRMPAVFGKVFAQSGSFSIPNYEFVDWELARIADPTRTKIWMGVGTMEWLIDVNRKMVNLLQSRGFNLEYHEYHGGHNFTSWGRDLAAGLAFLFPPNR